MEDEGGRLVTMRDGSVTMMDEMVIVIVKYKSLWYNDNKVELETWFTILSIHTYVTLQQES